MSNTDSAPIELTPEEELSQSLTVLAEIVEVMRPLDPEERAGLEASIVASGGARDPITVWRDSFLGNVIVDGINRHEICCKHGLPFDVLFAEFDSLDDAVNWVVDHQLARRNLSSADRARLVWLRSQHDEDGKPLSVRQAAKLAGVSTATVQRVREEMGDKKPRKQREAKQKPKANADAEPRVLSVKDTSEASPDTVEWPWTDGGKKIPADVWGQPVPERLVPLFTGDYPAFRAIVDSAKKLRRAVKSAEDIEHGGERLRSERAYALADELVDKLDTMVPYCICPACGGSGAARNAPDQACFPCIGYGWIGEEQLKRFPKDRREALEACRREVYGDGSRNTID